MCSFSCLLKVGIFSLLSIILQVDADFKLKDMKKAYKELEMKGKGYKKRLDELQTAIGKHLEQYVSLENCLAIQCLSF